MLRRSSNYHQTLSLLTLLRFYFKPTVSFMFRVVICDTCVLLALKGLPLRASGEHCSLENRIVPYSIYSSSCHVLCRRHCHASFTHRNSSSEADKAGQKNFDTRSGWEFIHSHTDLSTLQSTYYVSLSERARNPFLIDLGIASYLLHEFFPFKSFIMIWYVS